MPLLVPPGLPPTVPLTLPVGRMAKTEPAMSPKGKYWA